MSLLIFELVKMITTNEMQRTLRPAPVVVLLKPWLDQKENSATQYKETVSSCKNFRQNLVYEQIFCQIPKVFHTGDLYHPESLLHEHLAKVFVRCPMPMFLYGAQCPCWTFLKLDCAEV